MTSARAIALCVAVGISIIGCTPPTHPGQPELPAIPAEEPLPSESAPSDVVTPEDQPAAGENLKGSPSLPAGNYVITLPSGASAALAAAATEQRDVHSKVTYVYTNVLNGFAASLSSEEATVLAQSSEISSIFLDSEVHFSSDQTDQSDPSWGLDRIDQKSLPLDATYSSPSQGGAGVRVYVIDSGVETSLPEFEDRFEEGFDVGTRAPGGNGDCWGHGTHVAATIAGKTFGVAKQATIVPVRVLPICNNPNPPAEPIDPIQDAINEYSSAISSVLIGIDWVIADHQVGTPAVANLSLGFFIRQPLIEQATAHLIADGVSVVAAAGNQALPTCLFESIPNVPHVITVGAIDQHDRRAPFSNWGSCVDVFAPGVDILSSCPHQAKFCNPASDFAKLTGTSMASPHVAGLVALLLGSNPTMTPTEMERAVRAQAAAVPVHDALFGSPQLIANTYPASITLARNQGYTPLQPIRVLDTRVGTGWLPLPVEAEGKIWLQPLQWPSIPSNSTSVAVQITVVNPTGNGYATLEPLAPSSELSKTPPTLYFRNNQSTSIMSILPTNGVLGLASLRSTAKAHYIIDVIGFFGPSSEQGLTSIPRTTVVDSRRSIGGYSSPWEAGVTRTIRVRGIGGVPMSATGVVATLTSSQSTASGQASGWATGTPEPGKPFLSWRSGVQTTNTTIIPIGADGTISLKVSAGTADLTLDIAGYLSPDHPSSTFTGMVPTTILDSQTNIGTEAGMIAANTSAEYRVAGSGAIPVQTQAVFVNLSVVSPTSTGSLNVGLVEGPPSIAVSFQPGHVSNAIALIPIENDGKIRITNFSGAGTHIRMEVIGYLK